MTDVPTLDDNRRAHPRYKYVQPMQTVIARKLVKGFTADIGQGGVSFIVETMISPGIVIIEVPAADLVLEGRVLKYQPAAHPGLYHHHMQFTELLMTSVLERILG